MVYSYEGQILRDSITPPQYAWVELDFGDQVKATHGEGLWFWRGERLENLDDYTRRAIDDDGAHERSHRLLHTILEGESTVLFDQPVKNDGYGADKTAAEWASDEYAPFPPTDWYRGPKFEVVSIDDARVGLVLYGDQHISSAKHAAVDFEGNSVAFPGEQQPQWDDTTPPVDVSSPPSECGEVRIIDGHLHARSADSKETVEIERPTSSEPIGELIAVQWLEDDREVPLGDMNELPNGRRANSDALLAEARQASADGERKRARGLLAEALLGDGDNPEVLYEYGTLALEDGHLEAAQHALVAAYDHAFPRSTDESKDFRGRLLHQLGRLAEAQQDVDGAKEMYRRSLELSSKDEVKERLDALTSGGTAGSKSAQGEQTEPTFDASGAARSYQPTFPGLELGVCRTDATYQALSLDRPDAAVCKQLCLEDDQCVAFSLSLPSKRYQRDTAQCALQDEVTEGPPNKSNCMSWVKPSAD